MATKRGVIIFFVLAHIVLLLMMFFTFPRINARMGTQAFDLKTFGYSVQEAKTMIQNLDQATVNLYLFPQLFLFDVLYPILLATFLSLLMIRLAGLAKISPGHFLQQWYVLPFAAMMVDYLENILIARMITTGANVSSGLVKVASLCTQLKGALTMISWVVILVLFVVWIRGKLGRSATKDDI
jgi:hypothetical protein